MASPNIVTAQVGYNPIFQVLTVLRTTVRILFNYAHYLMHFFSSLCQTLQVRLRCDFYILHLVILAVFRIFVYEIFGLCMTLPTQPFFSFLA